VCYNGNRRKLQGRPVAADIGKNMEGKFMWIMLSDCFLSIVSKDCGPAELLVRARRAGDIEKVFPDAKVTRNTDSDYLYRTVLPRDAVKQALAAMIDHIDYPNFKDSVEDRSLHAAYVGVWCAMAGLQHPPPNIATHARSALTSKNTL
jgi:hypothetical protein